MTETIQESLLDNLLKSRYPLTYYLSRQQEFIKIFSTTQTNAAATPSESETNVIRKQKASLPRYYSIPDTIDPKAPEFNDSINNVNSDQDDNTAHGQNSDNDDDATQEYDEKPILKCINEISAVKH